MFYVYMPCIRLTVLLLCAVLQKPILTRKIVQGEELKTDKGIVIVIQVLY